MQPPFCPDSTWTTTSFEARALDNVFSRRYLLTPLNEPIDSPEVQAPSQPRGWRRAFTALSQPNYRLWFLSQLFSLMGTWMQSTAQGYLVYELTHSPAWLGYVAFAAGIPTWLFMLWAGVLADRVSRRRILIFTQAAMMLGAALIAALVFTHEIRAWHLVVLSLALGTSNAFDAPARQAFVLELVGRADLGNAIALNALMFNAAVVVGPAVGGLVYAGFGPGWCFVANAISFLPVIGALLAMRLQPRPPAQRRGSALLELWQGLVYVARHPSIRVILLLVAGVTILGFAYVSLIPAFAVNILHGDARTNGLLQTARGIGALAGAMYIASLGRMRRSGRLLVIGSLLMPLALLGFSSARTLPLAFGALVVVGLGLTLFYNNANALVQLLSDDALRGRVTSVYSLMFFGLLPIGSLAMGTVADRLGAPWTVGLGAAALIVCAAAMHVWQPGLRKLG